ncbi:DUF4767 domain-containing protein [Lacticaseibacillus daqingensis]|uniref:DUF4767 domain-containing protein n=1 Tax=Lacticaseibacillus daqingensis TaxID=2486014 RepID=UPI000F787D42|nr:DUF4767 domain-containing protein [Lacticaseibacillus daqingensis]
MKRVIGWSLVGFSALLLAGCGATTGQSKQPASQSSVSSPSEASPSTKKTEAPAAAPWGATKKRQLSAFMKQWSSEMGQHWIGTYDDQPLNYYGVDAEALTANQGITMTWGQQPIQMQWTANGFTAAEFQLLAAAYTPGAGEMDEILYLFCLHNGRPVIFTSMTTNGGVLYLADSQNVALYQGFIEIVTGKKPAAKTDADLNAANAATVAAKPQVWPASYAGTWYTYSGDAVQHFTNGFGDKHLATTDAASADGTGMRLDWPYGRSPQFINARGVQQTAGAGTDYYVRYRYDDGQQVPVMTLASGAGIWFDGNAYRTSAQAARMQNWIYGDEPQGR